MVEGASALVTDAARLTGPQKAAVILLQLGREWSAAVLASMSDDEVELIMSEAVTIGRAPEDVVRAVMTEFMEAASNTAAPSGGMAFVRDVLSRGLAPDRAEAILERIQDPVQPFGFVLGAERRQVVAVLAEEHPQTVALVMVQLPAGVAGELLGQLPSAIQADVARRIAELERPSAHVLGVVEAQLAKRLTSRNWGRNSTPEGGVQPLVDMLNRAKPSTEHAVLTSLDEIAPELGEEVRRHLFEFTDIVDLDDRAVQHILRDVTLKDLAMALKGASDEVRSKITTNLSTRAAENLNEEIALLGPVRVHEVEEARDVVIRTIRTLEEAGTIIVGRGDDDLIN
jgi:flagellar motor switch protein FliG